MTHKPAQRGFVGAGMMDLAFLFVLILIGIGVWQWLSTIVSGDFMLAFFMVWLMATAAAWWWTREQTLALRIPAGFLLFILLGLMAVPLSWWSGAKFVVTAEAVVLAVSARYLGNLWSARLKRTLGEGFAPWYLDQSINLINDLFLWAGLSIVAWFLVGVLPLMLVFVLPVEWIPWAAMLWGFGLTAYYLVWVRKSRVSVLGVPLGLWVMGAAAVILLVFEKQIAGPLEPGSIGVIAYAAYAPVVTGLFVEIAVLGTHKLLRSV